MAPSFSSNGSQSSLKILSWQEQYLGQIIPIGESKKRRVRPREKSAMRRTRQDPAKSLVNLHKNV
jgi:hypothetical protein